MTNMTRPSGEQNLAPPLQNWQRCLEGNYPWAPRIDRVHLQIMSELACVPEIGLLRIHHSIHTRTRGKHTSFELISCLWCICRISKNCWYLSGSFAKRALILVKYRIACLNSSKSVVLTSSLLALIKCSTSAVCVSWLEAWNCRAELLGAVIAKGRFQALVVDSAGGVWVPIKDVERNAIYMTAGVFPE